MSASWPCPTDTAEPRTEYAFTFDRGRPARLLILPALFDEGHKLRRLTLDVMRQLDNSGIDSFLPDLPGCNESLVSLGTVSLADWHNAVSNARRFFGPTHLLTLRAGAVLTPPDITGWSYAPISGAMALRHLLRARIVASREAGLTETMESLQAAGTATGIDLAGYRMGPGLFSGLQEAQAPQDGRLTPIAQDQIGGSGLWLRAEPDESPSQAHALATLIAGNLAA